MDFNETKERAANIAFNKIGEGNWDKEKLTMLLDELSKMPDFDLEITGFTPVELGQLIDRYLPIKDGDDFDFEKEINSIVEPITKRGDLIQLGLHRILCGDSSNLEDFKILMGEEKASLADVDFPYNVNLGGGDNPNPRTRPRKSHKWPQIYSDHMPQKEYEAWMRKILINLKEVLKPGGVIYFWPKVIGNFVQCIKYCWNLIFMFRA